MTELLNVFEHQRFRLRRADGSRTSKSFREILTENDDAYALDYSQEFYNIAALNLLAYLAQVAFEPETPSEIVHRLSEPMTVAAFDRALEQVDLRRRFALTGSGPRFMQGRPPENEKGAEPLAVTVFIAPKGERQFLFRSDDAWAVTPEQAGLLLFARNTFYEGTGGRGYQKGTNGDTPIRTLVTVPGVGSTIHVRESLWLNVLSREKQRSYPGEYADTNSGDFDGLFWEELPSGDVPIGGITLRAALGWMTAFHWLHFENSDETWTCPVTGETITGLVAKRVTKSSTGIAYGEKGDLDSGTRASRLFRHPNVPTRRRFSKGQLVHESPFQVDRLTGIVGALGAAFFGAHARESDQRDIAAPVVEQLHNDALRRWAKQARLVVFGFHMLSGQKNVHGGIEIDTFAFHPLGGNELEARTLNGMARSQLENAGAFAGAVAQALQRAIQQTAGAGVRASEQEDGSIRLERPERIGNYENPFGRDVLAQFWRAVQSHIRTFAAQISEAALGGPGALNQEAGNLQERWELLIVKEAWRLYRHVFEHYSTLPRTMPYAHAARRIFGATLKNARTLQSKPELV